MAKTNIEKIERLNAQIAQLENQKKRLMQVQKEAERRARTKRLIERGAILESLISGASTFSNDQIKAFLEKTIQSNYARKILDGFTAQDGTTAVEKSAWTPKTSGATAAGKATDIAQGAG